MARSLSSLWLKNLRSFSKVQRAQQQLLKRLLPKPARRPAAKQARPVRASGPGAPRQPVGAARLQTVGSGRKPAASLPQAGTWQKGYSPGAPPAVTGRAQARRLLYWLYLPPVADPGPLPLVVMLHGCQQSATDFATATRMNELAERKGFAVLYPQQSAAGDANRCWHWYQRAVQRGDGEVRVIADLIAQMQQRHGLDASRTYVAGLSAGAALATVLALRHPELVAAVGLHSAPVFGTVESALGAYRTMQRGAGEAHLDAAGALVESALVPPGLPAIVIHGERDSVVRRINAVQLAQQLQIVNRAALTRLEPTRRSYPARSTGRSPRRAWTSSTHYAGRRPQLVLCEIAGLGHAWSGGDDSVKFTERSGPDASAMMWAFFARHRLGNASLR